MSINVLYISTCFPSYQADSRYLYIWDSIAALKEININPTLLYTRAWGTRGSSKINHNAFPIDIINCRYVSIPRHYFRQVSNHLYIKKINSAIKQILTQKKINLIHAHGEIAGLAAVNASHAFGVPSVVTLHGVDMSPRKWKKKSGDMFSRMLNEAGRVIFVGDPLLAHFSHILNKDDHCRVVHNGVRLPEDVYKPIQDKKLSKPCVKLVSVSNLHEEKGVDLTLLALARLRRKGLTDWHYNVVGGGAQRSYLESIVKENNLNGQVTFTGRLSHEAVYAILKKSDIFCLPSYCEAFGIAYLEAMAHGLLTIGVDGQGPASFIENAKTGFLVKPRNIFDLAEKLKFSLLNFDACQDMALLGRKHVLTHFLWKQHAKKLMRIYQELKE